MLWYTTAWVGFFVFFLYIFRFVFLRSTLTNYCKHFTKSICREFISPVGYFYLIHDHYTEYIMLYIFSYKEFEREILYFIYKLNSLNIYNWGSYIDHWGSVSYSDIMGPQFPVHIYACKYMLPVPKIVFIMRLYCYKRLHR